MARSPNAERNLSDFTFQSGPIMKLCEVGPYDRHNDATSNRVRIRPVARQDLRVRQGFTGIYRQRSVGISYLLDAVPPAGTRCHARRYRQRIDARLRPPMGPLTLTDFIGTDTILYIADIMFARIQDSHYSAPPLLRRMVNSGYLGKKSGRGFYDYSAK